MRSTLKIACSAALAVMFLAGAAAAQDVDPKIKRLPGYVDFQATKLFKGEEARVEVFLKEPMLKLVSKFIEQEDQELYDILSKLKLVRVQVFDVDDAKVREFNEITKKTTAMLDEKGWERIVRVREDDENVDVYLRPSENYESILGIVVMVAEHEEAVFINVVGEIHPDDVARLGDHFDIHELEGLEGEIKKKKSRRNRD
jgi:hypothetical protein